MGRGRRTLAVRPSVTMAPTMPMQKILLLLLLMQTWRTQRRRMRDIARLRIAQQNSRVWGYDDPLALAPSGVDLLGWGLTETLLRRPLLLLPSLSFATVYDETDDPGYDEHTPADGACDDGCFGWLTS